MQRPMSETAQLQSEVASLRSELGVSERLRIAMYSSIAHTGTMLQLLAVQIAMLTVKSALIPTDIWRRWQKRTGGAGSSCVHASVGVRALHCL